MNAVLQFDQIVRAYKRGAPVLNGVSFCVNEAEVVGLLGPNGAGKTTLLRIAMGMLFPDSGSVRAFGQSPTEFPVEVKRRIGYVSEDQALPPGASTAELIAFHKHLFPHWDAALERELLDQFQLDPRVRIKSLSKGQARKVALLCAICHRPELLILDEPAGGLDASARRDFLEASIRLLNREGSAILFSSHYMDDVERIGGRVVLLNEGRVQLNIEVDRIREEICLAMVPVTALTTADALAALPGWLHTRRVFDSWHVVFEGSPEWIAARLRSELDLPDVRCTHLPLEELFIEMVGSNRKRVAS